MNYDYNFSLSQTQINLLPKFEKIKLLICDVDGVMTDGKLQFGEQGEIVKSFHVHDGLGIQLLQQNGIDVAIISARKSNIVLNRADNLGIKLVYQGNHNKLLAYNDLVANLQLSDSQVAYIGDDLPDLPLIKKAGIGVAVANANFVVKQQADLVTSLLGGNGAVRELSDLILFSQHRFKIILNKY